MQMRLTTLHKTKLTPRERDVVALVGEGLTNKAIAADLVLQECTVENHIHNILRKLRMKTRTQVARYAWQNGIRRLDAKE